MTAISQVNIRSKTTYQYLTACLHHQRARWSVYRKHTTQSDLLLVHELILKRGPKFRVGCTPRPTKIFLLILMVQHLYFLFQLVSSFKKCPFGLETACFDGTLRCGIWRAKISVQNILQNLVKKNTIHRVYFSNGVFFTKVNVSFIKKERPVTLV